MDRPPRKPEEQLDDAAKPPSSGPPGSSSTDEVNLPSPSSVEGSLRRTAPLPTPDLTRPRQRPGMQTESLAPPPIDVPQKASLRQTPRLRQKTTVLEQISAPLTPPPAEPATIPDRSPAVPSPPAESPAAESPAAMPPAATSTSVPPAATPTAAAAAATPKAHAPSAGVPSRGVRPPSPPSSSGLRIAAASKAQVPRPVAWGTTLGVVFLAGLLLWAVQGSLASSLDRWLTLPSWQSTTPDIVIEPRPVVEVEAEEPEDTGPVWTFETIEEALLPLPIQVQELSRAGGQEQESFADLARRKAPEALQRSRWENWRLVWGNRTLVLRQAMPPLDSCRPHAALEPTCLVVDETLSMLEEIAHLEDSTTALAYFERADQVLETWRLAKEAEEAAAMEAEALAAEALAAEALEAQALTDEILQADPDSGEGPDVTEPVGDVEVEDLLDPNG